MYADDMAVEVEEKNTVRVMEALELLERDNLPTNHKKTKSMTTSEQIKNILSKTSVETVDKFKYLGVTLTN
jgi:hypothetical protein